MIERIKEFLEGVQDGGYDVEAVVARDVVWYEENKRSFPKTL